MLGKEIKRLEKLKVQYQARLDSIHDADADPNVKAMHQSDIQCAIFNIDIAIEHEKIMMPLRYMLFGFVVAVLGLIIYFYL